MTCSCTGHFDQRLIDFITFHGDPKIESMLNEDTARASDCRGTLLHHAANADKDLITRRLIALGSPVDPRGQDGKTPLMLAVEGNHRVTVEVLLEAGADIDAVDANGQSALHKALNLDVSFKLAAAVLRRAKAETPRTEELLERLFRVGFTFAHAGLLGDAGLLDNLLRRGHDVDARDYHNERTALHHAVLVRDLALTKLLVDRGADVNARDAEHSCLSSRRQSPLYYAVMRGTPTIVQLLLDRGADPRAYVTHYDELPLYRCLTDVNYDEERVRECADILLQGGAFPSDSRWYVSQVTRHRPEIFQSSRLQSFVAHQAMIDELGIGIYDDEKHLTAFVELHEYYEKCRQVLIESAAVGETLLIDLLDDHEMRVRARNPEFIRRVEQFCSESTLKEVHPYYAKVLTKRISVAVRTVNLENEAIFVLCKLFRCDYNLLNVFARRVIVYLSERDLEQLCRV